MAVHVELNFFADKNSNDVERFRHKDGGVDLVHVQKYPCWIFKPRDTLEKCICGRSKAASKKIAAVRRMIDGNARHDLKNKSNRNPLIPSEDRVNDIAWMRLFNIKNPDV